MAKNSNISNIGKRINSAPVSNSAKWQFPLGRMNFYYLLAGLAVILIGFALMATGISEDAATVVGTWNNSMAITVAPILLIIGYCVLIPMGLVKKFNKSAKSEDKV